MIERLSSRRDLERLRAEGTRSGRGPVRLLHRPDATERARIAYAIPRSVGSAVARNRSRRRVREVIRLLDRSPAGPVPGGDYLVRVTGPIEHWTHDELRTVLSDLLLHDGRGS